MQGGRIARLRRRRRGGGAVAEVSAGAGEAGQPATGPFDLSGRGGFVDDLLVGLAGHQKEAGSGVLPLADLLVQAALPRLGAAPVAAGTAGHAVPARLEGAGTVGGDSHAELG